MKSRWINLAQVFFVMAVSWFGWKSLENIWPGVKSVLDDVSIFQIATSLSLVFLGLIATGVVWRFFLNDFGYRLELLPASRIFFIGQLGKYLPGSLWILGAQGQMARKHQIPARVAVSTGIVFLYWNVVTALVVAATLSIFGAINLGVPHWLSWALLFVSLLGLLPSTLNFIGNRLAAIKDLYKVTWTRLLVLLSLMLAAWTSFGTALISISPKSNDMNGSISISMAIAVYTFSYLAGVAVPLAPAGFGVREAAIISLLTPTLGLAVSTTIAILLRVIHTVADFGMAFLSWLIGIRHRDPITQ